MLKPSEFTSLVGARMASLLHAAGVPEDIFQVVIGDGATGAALMRSAIDKLVFTGSVATESASRRRLPGVCLPVVLELGGKDPMIVLEDADVEVASSAAVWGAFVNAGRLVVGRALLCASQDVRVIRWRRAQRKRGSCASAMA